MHTQHITNLLIREKWRGALRFLSKRNISWLISQLLSKRDSVDQYINLFSLYQLNWTEQYTNKRAQIESSLNTYTVARGNNWPRREWNLARGLWTRTPAGAARSAAPWSQWGTRTHSAAHRHSQCIGLGSRKETTHTRSHWDTRHLARETRPGNWWEEGGRDTGNRVEGIEADGAEDRRGRNESWWIRQKMENLRKGIEERRG